MEPFDITEYVTELIGARRIDVFLLGACSRAEPRRIAHGGAARCASPRHANISLAERVMKRGAATIKSSSPLSLLTIRHGCHNGEHGFSNGWLSFPVEPGVG